MRNLTLLGAKHLSFEGRIPPDTLVSAVALDLDEDCLYVATEHDTEDADISLEVWKIGGYSQQDDQYGSESVSRPLCVSRVLLITMHV